MTKTKAPPEAQPAADGVAGDGLAQPAWADDLDPRMEQRRAEVQQEHARGRRRVVLVLIAIIGLGSATWALTRTPLLAVDHARVSGIDATTVDDVLRAGHLAQGTPMTDIDEHGAARRLEALPWVRSARVRRAWPRTVRVEIQERTATAAATAAGGGWVLLDGTGRVLANAPAPPEDQPLLDGVPPAGPPGSRLAKAGRPALAVAAALAPELRSRVVLITAEPGGEVELRLRPEGVVRLGHPDRIAEKLSALRTMVARADLRRLAVLDLRVPGNPVLTRQP